jgi:hypothetical protein
MHKDGPAGGPTPRDPAHRERIGTVDKPSVAAGDPFLHAAQRSYRRSDPDQERPCFFCLGGWVFLGSIDHEARRQRRPSSAASAAARER